MSSLLYLFKILFFAVFFFQSPASAAAGEKIAYIACEYVSDREPRQNVVIILEQVGDQVLADKKPVSPIWYTRKKLTNVVRPVEFNLRVYLQETIDLTRSQESSARSNVENLLRLRPEKIINGTLSRFNEKFTFESTELMESGVSLSFIVTDAIQGIATFSHSNIGGG